MTPVILSVMMILRQHQGFGVVPMSHKVIFDQECNTHDNSTDYFYIIYGAIPETEPVVSFRRSGRVRSYGRKLIKCPHCKTRITDTEADTRVELFVISPNNPVQCQFHLTCCNCKRDVGVNIIIQVS